MDPLREFDRIFFSQVILLEDVKQIYRYLANHKLLDNESEIRFKELFKQGKNALLRSYANKKKLHQEEEKYERLCRLYPYGKNLRK